MKSDRVKQFERLIEVHRQYLLEVKNLGLHDVVVCNGNMPDHIQISDDGAWKLAKDLGVFETIEQTIHSKDTLQFSFEYDEMKVIWLI